MRKLTYLLAAIMVMATTLFTAEASAGWGCRGYGGSSWGGYGGYYGGSWGGYGGYYGGSWGGYGGSWGGYGGSYGSYGYGGYYGSGGCCGSYGWGGRVGVYARHRPHFRRYYGCGSSRGSCGSYGYATYNYATPVVSYACSTLGCGCGATYARSCGGEVMGTVISDGYSDGYMEGTPVEAEVPTTPEEADVMDESTSIEPANVRNSALLAVQAPAESMIFVNGHQTSSKGPNRKFLSSGLEPGKSYTYQVRAVHEGQAITKFVTVTPGQKASMSFDFAPTEEPQTVLTLNVPEAASVSLAGNATQQQGQQRVFSTSRLAPGKTWENYVVRVSMQKNGRTLTKEQTISIQGGESYEMRFDFNDNVVAAK